MAHRYWFCDWCIEHHLHATPWPSEEPPDDDEHREVCQCWCVD